MAAFLANAGPATLGARREAAQRGALLDEKARHPQLVGGGAAVVLRIRDGRLQRLADQARGLFLRKAQDVERLVDRLAAHQVGHQPAFLGRQPCAENRCPCFHFQFLRRPAYFLAGPGAVLRSAEWPLKVRVNANSPSLWPTIWSLM